MIAGAAWQDLVAVFAALLAAGWLFRRWRIKRRTRVGCDSCAASLHARMAKPRPPAGTTAEGSPR